MDQVPRENQERCSAGAHDSCRKRVRELTWKGKVGLIQKQSECKLKFAGQEESLELAQCR
jgi:hypothetical protein